MACVGGVNAVATFTVLPLGAIWLLLAPPGPRRRQLMLWWPIFVAMGTLWWLIPLFLLGAHSPPFLDFIESATTTTFAATLFDALRGTSNWIPYVDTQSVSGNALLRNSMYVINSAVVMTFGVLGLVRRDNPVRRFLVTSIVVGLVLVTLGHMGTGMGTATIQGLLDGVLAPLRNAHKFDPIIRLALIVGLVHFVSVVFKRDSSAAKKRIDNRAGVLILACAAVLGSTVPAWTAQLPNRGSYTGVPGYWHDTSDWLNAHAERQNTLLLPGSSFGDYLWGSPRDEVLQSLARTPWSVRSGVPLTPAGNIRTLDAIEQAFASGRGSTSLTAFLQRSEIRYLVVRNDLDEGRGVTKPELIYSTLSSTPGVHSIESFGPEVGSPASQETDDGDVVFINRGLQSRHPAVEIFEVTEVDSALPHVQDLEKTPVVAGSPAALIALGGSISAGTAVLLAGDTPPAFTPQNVVLTDTNRRQEVAFGRVIDNRSASLAKSDEFRIDRPVHDYELPGGEQWKAVPELRGAKSIRASSSGADVTANSMDPAKQPWSAFDDDPLTSWTAGQSSLSKRAWIEIEFLKPISVKGTTLTLSPGQPDRTITVTTDSGSRKTTIDGATSRVLDAPVGLTKRLRISAQSSALEPLTIDEIDIPNVQVSRPLRMPAIPKKWGTPSEILMTATPGDARCFAVESITRCLPGEDGLGEDGRSLDRIFTLNTRRAYGIGARVLPMVSNELTDYFSGEVRIRTSSTVGPDPAASVLAAIDGNPHTGWISTLGDVEPEIGLRWDGERTLSRLKLGSDPTLAASAPKTAELLFSSGEERTVRFDVSGLAKFEPVDATGVTIRIDGVYVRSSLAFDGTGSGLPVGISDISLPGSGRDLTVDSSESRDLPCGSGPSVDVDGQPNQTSVSASLNEILSGDAVVASYCGRQPVSLAAGEHRVIVKSSGAFRPTELQFGDANMRVDAGDAVTDAKRTDTGIEVGRLPAGGKQLVSLSQNFNKGWQAKPNGNPVAVNGWMQGWIAEPGTTLGARFSVGWIYQSGLAIGLITLFALFAFAVRLRGNSYDGAKDSSDVRLWFRVPLGVATAIVATVLLAGGWGTLIGVASAAAALAWSRRWSAEWMVAVGVIAAASAYVLQPWGSAEGWAGVLDWPQWCVASSIWVASALVFEDQIRVFLKRIIGFSTTR